MKKFVLHGEMADLFTSEICLDVKSASEALHALSVNFKDFKPYIVGKSLEGVSYDFIDTNDVRYDNFCGNILLKDSEYHIVPTAQGGAMMAGFMGSPLGGFLANAGLGYGMQKLSSKLMENTIQSDNVPEYEVIETNSYIYTQNDNKIAQGSPVPLVYGQLRIGSKILNSSIENYDYDYENALIYQVPQQLTNINKIKNGQYSFVTPLSNTNNDYRATSDESMDSYSLEDKRVIDYGGENGAKAYTEDAGNESFNQNYATDSWSAERKTYGPSVDPNRPNSPDGGATSVSAGNSSPRPYVFPAEGSKDGGMRPQGSNELCVERESVAGQSPTSAISLAFTSPSRNMTVGDRGSYQKLQSIGIYKSMEIISEGPIAGLANPITGFNRDNGDVSYPLDSNDESISSSRVVLSPVKYIESADHLGNINNGNINIPILSSGKNYNSLANQTWSFKADGYKHNGLSVRASKPSTSYKADINHADFIVENEIEFFANSATSNGKFYYGSSNRAFLIDPDNGRVYQNNNTNSSIDGYIEPSAIVQDGGNAFINLDYLSQTGNTTYEYGREDVKLRFDAGEGYPSTDQTFIIDPLEEPAVFEVGIEKSSFSDRVSQAKCLDLGYLMNIGENNQNVSYSSARIIEESVDQNIPGHSNLDWENMCRIYLDSTSSTLPSDPTSSTNTIHIPVGLFYRMDNSELNSSVENLNGSQDSDPFQIETIEFEDGESINNNAIQSSDSRFGQLYLKLNAGEYIGLHNVSDWNGWENWYYKEGGSYKKVKNYSHDLTEERPSANQVAWSNLETYNNGNIVSYGGRSLQAKTTIPADINVSNLNIWSEFIDYSLDNQVAYNNQPYKAKASVQGNPNVANARGWSNNDSYIQGNIVSYNSNFYELSANNILAGDPIDSSVNWSTGVNFVRGNIATFNGDYYRATDLILADQDNTAPTGGSPWVSATINDTPNNTSSWTSLTVTSAAQKNPSVDTTNWELIQSTNTPPPTSDSLWSTESDYVSGDVVEYNYEIYECISDIDGTDSVNDITAYNPMNSKVAYGTDCSGGTCYAYNIDDKVSYNTQVYKANKNISLSFDSSGEQLAISFNASDWDQVQSNSAPDSDATHWLVNSRWKIATRGRNQTFDKNDYGIFCYYLSRVGIAQNPDQDPQNPSGWGAVGNFFGGGAIKWMRQWIRSDFNKTYESPYWRALINGNGSTVTIGRLIKDKFTEGFEGESVVYEKRVDGGAFKSDKSEDQTIDGITLHWSNGVDFNDKIISLFGSTIPSSLFTAKDSRFSNSLVSGGSLSSSDETYLRQQAFKSCQTRHIKFSIGSGGDSNYDILSNPSSSLVGVSYANSFPLYMNQAGTKSFADVEVVEPGFNPEDDSDCPYGFYNKSIYPRVTVYVLRRKDRGVDTHPTKIEAVAKVDQNNGTIEKVYLIKVPEKPVWDTNISAWTHIFPQGNQSPPHYHDDSEDYQDLGFHLKVDKTNGYEYAELDIGSNGQISNSSVDFKLNEGWDEYVKTAIFERDGPANMNNQQQIDLIDENNFHKPTSMGKGSINTETIASGGSIDSGLPSSISTGRPLSLSVTNAGANYNANRSLSKIIQQEFYTIRTLSSDKKERGYKPHEVFYAYGLPKSKFDSGSAQASDISTKVRLAANEYGVFDVNLAGIDGVQIIDSGDGFSGENDSIVFLSSTYHSKINSNFSGSSNLTSLKSAFSTLMATRCGSNNNDDESNKLDPHVQYPKQSLEIEAKTNAGQISKFRVKTDGLGFNPYETLRNPFQSTNYTPPKLNLTFDAGGSLASASIDRTSLIGGYNINDTHIDLVVSAPPPTQGTVNNATQDEYAKFRSIYLNDVPIRDHNGRFNYSKFHFDMRIGHHKNGSGTEHPVNGDIALSAQPRLISDEFRIPTHTKFVNYPLFGPRNENEKDYFYSHTIKNPEVSDVAFSIKINQLHYIYEGDESGVYLNLIPIIGAILGWMVGKAIAKNIASAIWPDPVTTVGMGAQTGFSFKTNKFKEIAINLKTYAVIIAGGILGAVGMWYLLKGFKCEYVPWLCIKIGETIKNSGEIWPAKMRLAIEYGVEGETLSTDTIVFRGCATSPYMKDIFINNLPSAEPVASNSDVRKNRIFRVYRTTRELDPVTGGLIEARYKIDAELLSVTEYVGGFFSYPNSAIVGTRFNSKDSPQTPRREYLIKGALVKVPSNYLPQFPLDKANHATKSAIELSRYSTDSWDGVFHEKLKWTSNPAWIIYDLLTNPRYGMGKYGIKDEDIDRWSFYKFAQRCDEEVDVIVDGKQTSERRHMCNIYIDSERQAYDYIRDLMQIYNTTINFSGGTIHITQDAPAEGGPIMLFNNSNVSDQGFAYSSTPETARVTAVTVDFIDERDNYMRKTEYVEDAEGVREHGYSHAKIAGTGVTRRGEAHRLAWQKILTRQLEKEIVSFSTGIHGSYLRIGDVIELMDNNKVSKHSGGRICKIKSNSVMEIDIPVSAIANATSICVQVPTQEEEEWSPDVTYNIDDVVFDSSGEFYKLIVNSLSGNSSNPTPEEDEAHWIKIEVIRQKQFKEYSISSTSGFEVTLGVDSNSASPRLLDDSQDGAVWIIKENDQDKIKPRQYRVKEIKEVSSLNYEVMAMEYIEDKYNQIDNSTGAQKGVKFESREYYGHTISVS